MNTRYGRSDRIRTCPRPPRSHSRAACLRLLGALRSLLCGVSRRENAPPGRFRLLTLGPESVRAQRSRRSALALWHKNRGHLLVPPCFYGRSDRIRTCGLLVPNQAHYQAVPHPDLRFQTQKSFYHSENDLSSGFCKKTQLVLFFGTKCAENREKH